METVHHVRLYSINATNVTKVAASNAKILKHFSAMEHVLIALTLIQVVDYALQGQLVYHVSMTNIS